TKGETSGNATTYTVKNTDKMTLSLSATGDSWIGVSDANGSTQRITKIGIIKIRITVNLLGKFIFFSPFLHLKSM
ncbi:hypothetical protein C9828_15010, partial [Listeria monocytogenes]